MSLTICLRPITQQWSHRRFKFVLQITSIQSLQYAANDATPKFRVQRSVITPYKDSIYWPTDMHCLETAEEQHTPQGHTPSWLTRQWNTKQNETNAIKPRLN